MAVNNSPLQDSGMAKVTHDKVLSSQLLLLDLPVEVDPHLASLMEDLPFHV